MPLLAGRPLTDLGELDELVLQSGPLRCANTDEGRQVEQVPDRLLLGPGPLPPLGLEGQHGAVEVVQPLNSF